MTKVEQFLEKLNAKFFGEPDATTNTDNTQTELGSAKLADGTEIKWEGELAEGVAIMLADGSPAPDGEHTLEDGTVVAVQGGVVAAIRQPEAPEGEDMSAKMSAEMALQIVSKFADPNDNTDLGTLKKIIKLIFDDMYGWQVKNTEKEKAIQELAATVQTFGEQYPKEISKVVETQKELFELVKAFGETKTEDARKDAFRAAEHNLSTREAILTERFKKNIKRK